MDYIKVPKADEEYVVTVSELDGWVNIKNDQYDNCELVDAVGERNPYEIGDYEGAYFRIQRDGRYIHEIWYSSNLGSPYTKAEARQIAQELCDELNRKYNPSNN